jgi:predicted pyridoxine 5'-phosphate oxidase superfamily flavin-nucleotide-binding protein
MSDELSEQMQEYLKDRFMFFLGTADENGETDVSPRMGPQGFVQILDSETIAYPEFRGNGVHASLGNMLENPQATMLFLDWWDSGVGLHINGEAELREETPDGAVDQTDVDKTKMWVVLDIEEAYIHCAKHIPKLEVVDFDPPWGTDDPDAKEIGYFSE